MQRQTRADLAMALAIVLLGASLIYSGLALIRLTAVSPNATQPPQFAELLGVAGAGIGVAVLFWWLAGLVFACLGGVARALGAHRLAAMSDAWTPAFMRRLALAVLGLNLIVVPMAQAAEAPGIDPQWHPQTAATAPATPAATPTQAATTMATPSPAASADAEIIEPRWVPHAFDPSPGPFARPSIRPAPEEAESSHAPDEGASGTVDAPSTIPGEAADGSDVVVKRGDSLWSIVAQAMGPYSNDVDVAQAWPRWYSANRQTIGPDPNLIVPGQVLHAPKGN